ncbi:hypothetical protein [Leucobacter luti]|uniref:hypothetical protein n=1 Tax=Leucobacter luti TaxID=340320 RepID=UPI001404E130|nr:hypothetical protein [Leucobacter luti]MCW2289684.1 hypothetical protein [Leucobacter luti]
MLILHPEATNPGLVELPVVSPSPNNERLSDKTLRSLEWPSLPVAAPDVSG